MDKHTETGQQPVTSAVLSLESAFLVDCDFRLCSAEFSVHLVFLTVGSDILSEPIGNPTDPQLLAASTGLGPYPRNLCNRSRSGIGASVCRSAPVPAF